ncbi:PREDICTED: uncharacterized protein LOC105560687 [Vollenhovia emeryi]|uniref:uncharacterized protein LOC105560687 n=1 Tax=Vollenhovia emeryi TaxID=411798 RepID=UPI0005F44AD1|nr:PREDICTED: uncharacterized protein LOC105560687 [Vollenhovia emeryi]XP_011865396.1 PREDICTED: uncharacterized protein LOC105560687 [Vollenhovia emeryi]
MADNSKVVSRPKVRFCQFSDVARNEERTVGRREQQAVEPAARASGPTVKEMVTLSKPIRVVDLARSTNVDGNVPQNPLNPLHVSLSNCNVDNVDPSHYGTALAGVRNSSPSDKDAAKVAMIVCGVNGGRNVENVGAEENCRTSQLDKSSRDDVARVGAKYLRQKGKVSKGDDRVEKANARPAFKVPKITKSQSAPSVMKKMFQGGTAKPSTTRSRVTSRSDYKTVAKNKVPPVKKIVFRNVSGPNVKTSVVSRVSRREQIDARPSEASERRIVQPALTVQDLTQPEYNSIICTINKLKELEQQKIVADISHLPPALKNFLNGKISAALDFPLDEAIYQNLVDLSIDERQLPSTITRSKDPEPRQKDLAPKLDDFFTPEDTLEICEAVHVKSRASKIDDNWNAFKISDRILEWKYSID